MRPTRYNVKKHQEKTTMSHVGVERCDPSDKFLIIIYQRYLLQLLKSQIYKQFPEVRYFLCFLDIVYKAI